MPISIVHEGEVKDYVFIKQNEFTYAFYLQPSGGKRKLVGQIFKGRRKRWSAVGREGGNKMNRVEGFASRYDAATYLLRLSGHTE